MFDLSAALDPLFNSSLEILSSVVSRPRATWLLIRCRFFSVSFVSALLSPFAKCGPCPRCNPLAQCCLYVFTLTFWASVSRSFDHLTSNYSSRLPTAFGRKSKLLRMVYKALHDLVSHLTSLPLPLLFSPFSKSYHFELIAVLQALSFGSLYIPSSSLDSSFLPGQLCLNLIS